MKVDKKAEDDIQNRSSGIKSFRYVVSFILWPLIFCYGLIIMAYGYSTGNMIPFFIFSYFSMIAIIAILERVMPHEKEWLEKDGQTLANIGHTLVSKGAVQGVLLFGGVLGLNSLIPPLGEPGFSIWPRSSPVWVQVILGMVAAEFMLYWAHRLSHEVPFLWRFHAVHHSVTRLWVINTGRFHFVDALVSIVLGISILIILGAPRDIIDWLSVITAYIGLLTHCNIEMRFGPVSWLFNTPGLHRWHHSRDIRENNKNYGENLMIWDWVFGTYYSPNRKPPVNIGINEYMPAGFTEQIMWPFRKK